MQLELFNELLEISAQFGYNLVMDTFTRTNHRAPFERKELQCPCNSLRKIRLALGLTLEEFAQGARTRFQQLSTTERTGKGMDTKNWAYLADWLSELTGHPFTVSDLLNPLLELPKNFSIKNQ